MDTGFTDQDVQTDFARARRRSALARLSTRLRREPGDVNVILPFEEVVAALGRRGERRLGLRTIPLDSIVGSVDRTRDFDRDFRPTSRRVRQRWERIAAATRRGQAMPPIDVYRLGDLHFVKDGHHRVSVARAMGNEVIEADVTQVITDVGPGEAIRLADLPVKSHERLFFERVPLPAKARERIRLSRGADYAKLAEGVEAWGMRVMQSRREFMDREEVAAEWFDEDYRPIVSMLREADLIGTATETEAYVRITALRYMLLRTHEWDDRVLERLREELRRPAPAGEDTGVHELRGAGPR
ncbi:MAG TPA: hypothetical protein VFY99_09490 [Solirubrobacterales bacterium]